MWFYKEDCIIDRQAQREMMTRLIDEARAKSGRPLKKALLLPPDITRYHSGSGELTSILYHLLEDDCEVDVIPALGQHVPHTPEENKWMFGDIPEKRIQKHDWKNSCVRLNNLGQIITPLRGCYNYAEKTYLGDVPAVFVQIVRSREENGDLPMTGLYVGQDTETYVQAARYARRKTVFMFENPLKKVICFMDGKEFHSTWVANKAIYRTRKVIEDGGELIIIAPGVERFGEQEEVDRMIRKYGYKGTPHSLEAYKNDVELNDLAHAAAHLIHGSTEGRFTVTYAPGKLSAVEVEGVGFNYMDINEAMALYSPEKMRNGINIVNGEEVYFIDSPSLGLWTSAAKFKEALDNNMAFCERMIAMQPDEEVWRQIRAWNQEDI
jgi:nickel-dependent lactate racemase